MTNPELLKLKALLVDDDSFVRSTLRQSLIQIGFPPVNVHEASDGSEAMRMTLNVRPHVVLCDIHMPVEDGFAYLLRLRKAPIAEVAAIPVIMLTADSVEKTVMIAKELYVDGYLVKPVSIDALRRTLGRALRSALPWPHAISTITLDG